MIGDGIRDLLDTASEKAAKKKVYREAIEEVRCEFAAEKEEVQKIIEILEKHMKEI